MDKNGYHCSYNHFRVLLPRKRPSLARLTGAGFFPPVFVAILSISIPSRLRLQLVLHFFSLGVAAILVASLAFARRTFLQGLHKALLLAKAFPQRAFGNATPRRPVTTLATFAAVLLRVRTPLLCPNSLAGTELLRHFTEWRLHYSNERNNQFRYSPIKKFAYRKRIC